MADITGASFPLKLGEKTYQLSPLLDIDIEELNNWLRSTFIDMARSSIPANASKAVREETLAVAMREARRLSWVEGYGAELMSSGLDGITRVIFQSIKKNHPDLKFEDLRSELMNPDNLETALVVWRNQNLISDSSDNEKKRREKKNKKRREQRKRAKQARQKNRSMHS